MERVKNRVKVSFQKKNSFKTFEQGSIFEITEVFISDKSVVSLKHDNNHYHIPLQDLRLLFESID